MWPNIQMASDVTGFSTEQISLCCNGNVCGTRNKLGELYLWDRRVLLSRVKEVKQVAKYPFVDRVANPLMIMEDHRILQMSTCGVPIAAYSTVGLAHKLTGGNIEAIQACLDGAMASCSDGTGHRYRWIYTTKSKA